MDTLKAALLEELRKIEGVEDRPAPVSGGSALFYRGKAFAHVHDERELDLRLTKKVIQALGLSHPPGSRHHPGRTANSAWLEVRYDDPGDFERVSKLVRLAVAQL